MERTGIQRFLFNIWPAIYKLINGTFYFLLNLIKKTTQRAIEQIKHG